MLVVEIGKISFKAWDIAVNNSNTEVKQLLLNGRLDFSEEAGWNFYENVAGDIAGILKNRRIKTRDAVIVLEDEIIKKEFAHPKLSARNINMLAKIEAESLLREDISDFSIVCRQYDGRLNADNEMTSVLYALKNRTISEIVDAFAKSRLKVIKIVAASNAYTNMIKRLLKINKIKEALRGGTFTAVDFSEEKVFITVFENSKVVLQRRLNSVFYDLVSLLCETGGYDWTKASRFICSRSEASDFPEEFISRAEALVSTSVYDVLRTARANVAGDNVELPSLLISGELCACPIFYNILQKNLNVPHYNIEELNQHLSGAIKYNTVTANLADVLIACGAAIQSDWLADILTVVKANRRVKRAGRTFNAFLGITVAAGMCILPAVYYVNTLTLQKDEKRIEELSEIKQLHDQSAALQVTLQRIDGAEKTLGSIDSKSADILNRIFNTYGGMGEIEKITYNGITGNVETSFAVNSPDVFIKLKDKVLSDSFYKLNLNMRISTENNMYRGVLNFTTTEVTPPNIGKEGASK